ncbi:MAG: hypothetical protein GX034_02810 [Clostridiaceae bacterium]|jgi:hypothetical protein|nr:hypothetical protein [Clostridiaceae bacterium]
MASNLLAFVRNFNKPLEKFVIKNGWNFRLLQRKLKGKKFKKLTLEEKREVRSYWRRFGRKVSPAWAAYYSAVSGNFDPRYIPESLYYSEIVQRLGDIPLTALNYKNVQDQVFSSKQPKTILHKSKALLTDAQHRPLDLEEAVAACKAEGQVIIKPSGGSYGSKGIVFWSHDDDEKTLRDILQSDGSLIIQAILKPHHFFSDIHPDSLNTLRLVTLIIDREVVLLSSILRMGSGANRVDNTSAGGILAVVEQDGSLREGAIQINQKILSQHPDGFVFKEQKIPHFDRILEDVRTQCWRVPGFRLVFWDYVVDPAGDPVLIEANFPTGQIESHQFNNGPLFGDYSDKVLDFVYNDKPL